MCRLGSDLMEFTSLFIIFRTTVWIISTIFPSNNYLILFTFPEKSSSVSIPLEKLRWKGSADILGVPSADFLFWNLLAMCIHPLSLNCWGGEGIHFPIIYLFKCSFHYSWHTIFYFFQEYKQWLRHLCTLWSDHPDKSSTRIQALAFTDFGKRVRGGRRNSAKWAPEITLQWKPRIDSCHIIIYMYNHTSRAANVGEFRL